MSEHTIPAPPRSPPRPTNGPEPLPPLDQLRRHGRPGRDPRRAEARPRPRTAMPPAGRSGYEEILAARGALRARATHAAAEDRHAPADPAADRPAAVQWAAEQPARRGGPLPRRFRAGLVVPGLVAAPACALLAFVWVLSRHAPPSVAPVGATIPPSLVSYRASDAAVPAVPSGDEEALVFAARDSGQALPGMDDAAPDGDVSVPSPPGGVEAGRAAIPPVAAEEAAPVAQGGGGATPLRAAGTGFEPLVGSALPLLLPSNLEEESAVSAASDRGTPPQATGAATATPPASTELGPASVLAGGEADPVAVEGHGPAFAAPDRYTPAPGTDAVSDTRGQDGPAARPAVVSAAAAEPAGDAPPEGVIARATPDGAPAPVPTPEDAGAAASSAREDAPHGPAVAGSFDREPAPAVEAPPEGMPAMSTGRPDFPALAVPAAVPDAATPAAPFSAEAGTDAAARALASGGTAAAPPVQQRLAAAPPPLGAFPSAGEATPAKLRSGGPPPVASRAATAPPPPDSRCRAIILKAQLGEETSHAERVLLRSGCGARR